MPQHIDLGSIKCSINESFLYDGDKTKNRWLKAAIVGASSYAGHSLTFHVLIEESGGLFSYIPIHALADRKLSANSDSKASDFSGYDYRELDYHFCPDNNVTNITFGHLRGKDVRAWVKSCISGTLNEEWGKYITTFDWPDGNILQHMILMSNKQYALVPNHKMLVTGNMKISLPDYKKMRKEWT